MLVTMYAGHTAARPPLAWSLNAADRQERPARGWDLDIHFLVEPPPRSPTELVSRHRTVMAVTDHGW
jgi:hypothetical protein